MVKLALTAAVMDLCHKGHINLLQKMREEAGEGGLVVAILHNDKSTYENKGKIPIQSLEHRVHNLKVTGLVDIVQTCGDYDDLSKKITEISKKFSQYDIVFMRGDDWTDFPARKTIKECGIKVKFIPYTKGISSTIIRNDLENKYGV